MYTLYNCNKGAMGTMCPMSPQLRVINGKNRELQKIVKSQLQGLQQYGFWRWVMGAMREMLPRYMYNEGILEDIQKIHSYCRRSSSAQSENSISETIQNQLRNSCLILQNELNPPADEDGPVLEHVDSFQNNIKNNKSIVGVINMIYKKEIQFQEYSHALQIFLKWANIFQEHAYGGFLKPLYKGFYDNLKLIPMKDFTSIVDELCAFVQFMVALITDIYGLKVLASAEGGKLIKNENVYNLIMSYIFKKTKVKRFLIQCINHNEFKKIQLLEQQLHRFGKRPTYFFGIDKKFTLYDTSMTESEINKSMEMNVHVIPYQESLKLVEQLSKSGSPVTKLKLIVAVSKRIVRDIQQYYDTKKREAPELDPDNLSSIVMYLLARTGNRHIYQQLKIVQHFTTTNCLNCISGYYLNVFVAAIESILQLNEEQ